MRQGFRNVVADLDVGAPELLAVLAVESETCGFLPDRRPIIDDSRYLVCISGVGGERNDRYQTLAEGCARCSPVGQPSSPITSRP